jgi:hypothetical protein
VNSYRRRRRYCRHTSLIVQMFRKLDMPFRVSVRDRILALQRLLYNATNSAATSSRFQITPKLTIE